MFQETVVLQSSWDRSYVRKKLRNNLNHGGFLQPFLVSSAVEKQREWVEAYLRTYYVPARFFSDTDRQRGWKCLVGLIKEESMSYAEGSGPNGEPPVRI